ncbi:MAG: PQQ-binding-like beta-propeller repeat protein, partial [Sinobacteraceae bacterium]|nr:PQQ-binding-like beta-propeller repeat protein [Nevskiaceae bacterium]
MTDCRLMASLAGACALLFTMQVFAAATPHDTDWLSYNGTANGQRYSTLSQINTKNAASLKQVCRVKVADGGSFQTSPLEIDGVVYLTTPLDTLAIDATTCKILWRNVYHPQQRMVYPANRGVAYANGRLFRGTPDARLLAIDAKTGKTVWQEQIGSPARGEFISAAPAVWEGLIIIGNAGSDWGARGRIMAFDQTTGREVWRFNIVPTGDEPGADSWEIPDTAFRGGGASWTTYTLDMADGLVFVPTANPAPDFVPHHRPGANLYTNSLVVLDARTGKLKWYYQLTPHDGHDLDLGAPPMLYFNSKSVPMVAVAGKDGHVYGLDRRTHKAVFKTAVTTIKDEDVAPTEKGIHTCPGPLGGTEWNGVAYDAKNTALIVPSVDWCATLKLSKKALAASQVGDFYFGGSFSLDPRDKSGGWLTALDPDNGKIRWRYDAGSPIVAGVTPTAGDVTFTGDMDGHFLVLDSATGKLLLKSQTDGAVAGGVITYRIDGRQY